MSESPDFQTTSFTERIDKWLAGDADDPQEIVTTIRDRLIAAEEALEFYATPGNYHAIAFLPDPPCGDFCWDDFSECPEWDQFYDRAMPGKQARAYFEKWAR